MKKIIIGLVAFSSISAFAQISVLERTTKVVADYTPVSFVSIISSEEALNRVIAFNYVSGAFFGNLNQDLKNEFGKCAHGALWDREEISILQLSEAISKQCNL